MLRPSFQEIVLPAILSLAELARKSIPNVGSCCELGPGPPHDKSCRFGRRTCFRQPLLSHRIIQQLREEFPYQAGQRFLIFDRDSKYGLETPIAVRSMGLIAVRTSFESPWQNGVAERWVESCRRDLLDHVIAMNEAHLKRLLSEYVSYFHEDRNHLGLQANDRD